MKRIQMLPSLVLILLCFSTLGQKLKKVENSENVMESIMAINLQKRSLPGLNYKLPEADSFSGYQNSVSVLAPHQHNLSMCSPVNFANNGGLILGSIHQTNTTIGRKKLIGTYVFDVMGNMVDYQFTISKSK